MYAAYREHVTEIICADWPSTTHGNHHIDVFCDAARPLPFAPEQFDTVLLSDVLEHIPEPLALCQEIARILVPGGRIILNAPFYYWIHERPHDYYRYTEFALRRFMAAVSLEITTLAPVGGAPEIIVDILGKELARVPRIGWRLAATLQGIASRLLEPSGREIWTRRSAASFPLGYVLIATKRGNASGAGHA